MLFTYDTERLNLSILTKEHAPCVLDFYYRNKEIFDPWESTRCKNFYSLDYHEQNLEAEMKYFLKQKFIRYYLLKKNNPDYIIGTISFTNIRRSPSNSCLLGYRIDKEHQRHGYASEALLCLIPIIMKELNMFRIEADVMPSNIPSKNLLEVLGFTYEGVARGSFEINGKREDHLHYSLLYSDLY